MTVGISEPSTKIYWNAPFLAVRREGLPRNWTPPFFYTENLLHPTGFAPKKYDPSVRSASRYMYIYMYI